MGQLDKYVIEMGYVSGSEVLRIRIFIKVMIRPGSGVLRISNFIKYRIRPGSGVLRISNFIKYKIRPGSGVLRISNFIRYVSGREVLRINIKVGIGYPWNN